MAFFKGSYYETVATFEEDSEGQAFRGPRARPIGRPQAVLEHAIMVGDRLDALGQHFYANPRDWRRLADCNPEAMFAEDLVLEPLAFPQPDVEDPATPDLTENARVGKVILVPRRREGA